MNASGHESARRRGGPQSRLGDAAKAAFVTALRLGSSREEAARASRYSLHSLYRARRLDPEFAKAWKGAISFARVTRIIAPGNHRRVQSRIAPHLRFDDEQRQIFLAHFAGTCNVAESAEVAGVSEDTVYRHRAKDPAFAAAFQEGLDQGYVRLEAEALRQRLEAQKALNAPLAPTGEVAVEFDRVMKLLARWDRRNGGVGARRVSKAKRPAASFNEAIEALASRLQALDIPVVRKHRDGNGAGT